MVTEDELKRLMQKAMADPACEPAMLHGLLRAPVYVLIPLSDDSGRVRLITYSTPQGMSFIPFFSDLDRARMSAQGMVNVVRVVGRELFEATRGATLMLDPNNTSMTLYPEEISALLEGGLNVPAAVRAPAEQVEIVPAQLGDAAAVAPLLPMLVALPEVVAIHLVRRHMPEGERWPVLVAVVAAPDTLAERVARTLSVAVERCPKPLTFTLDVLTYDPARGRPDWLAESAFDPIWAREPEGPDRSAAAK